MQEMVETNIFNKDLKLMFKMPGFGIYLLLENKLQSTSVSQESDENIQYHRCCIKKKRDIVFPSEELERTTVH